MGEGAGGSFWACVGGAAAACDGGSGKDNGVGALDNVVVLAVGRICSFIEK